MGRNGSNKLIDSHLQLCSDIYIEEVHRLTSLVQREKLKILIFPDLATDGKIYYMQRCSIFNCEDLSSPAF